MSGWLALVRTDGAAVEPAEVEHCMRQLRSRGPHGEAVTVEGCGALGLTVLDTGETVAAARQPVRAGKLVVTGHARLDDRPQVGRMLGVDAAELAALSDLALLARALERFGDDVPARVFGEYAAAAWDASARRLTVVRDALGVRPAYVARVGALAIAASSLDAVRAHPAVSDRLDDRAVLEFLLFEVTIDPERTPFLDVRVAPPGGSWTASPEGARARVAWTLPEPVIDRRSPWRELALRWRDALDVATADRVRGARASLTLSGGIDSTAIAASAARLDATSLYATTDVLGAVARGRDDEGEWAASVARHLGIRHDVFVIGAPPPALPWRCQPCLSATPSVDPLDVSDNGSWPAMARHGVVVLHGEGGDEIWRTSVMPELLGVEPWGSLASGVVETLAHRRRPALGLNVRGRLRGTRRRPRPPAWLSDELRRSFDVEQVLRAGQALIAPRALGPRAGSLTGLRTALWRDTLLGLDAFAATYATELRLPLLDLRVVAAALALPPLPAVVDKLAARHALADRLPAAVVSRRKTPAAVLPDRSKEPLPWGRLPEAPSFARYVDVALLRAAVEAAGTTWEALRAVALWRWLAGGARRPDER